jgi:hypothetical protein
LQQIQENPLFKRILETKGLENKTIEIQRLRFIENIMLNEDKQSAI